VILTVYAVFFLVPATHVRVEGLRSEYGLEESEKTPFLNRLPYTFYKLIVLLVFPLNLSIFHEGEVITAGKYLFMIILTVNFFLLIMRLYKTDKVKSGLLIMLMLSVLPTLSPVQVAFFMAERYLYIGSAFACMFLALVIVELQKKHAKNRGTKKLILTFVILLVSSLSIRSFTRVFDWKNSGTLWEATAKTAPLSPRVYNNLGDAYAQEKRMEKSVWAFQKAIELKPEYVDAIHNLGNDYLEMGMLEEAKTSFERALSLNPKYEGAEKAKQILTALQEKTPSTSRQE